MRFGWVEDSREDRILANLRRNDYKYSKNASMHIAFLLTHCNLEVITSDSLDIVRSALPSVNSHVQ